MKKTQLEKLKAAQIESQMRRERGLIPASAAEAVDRKEQRQRDRAAGLVPFAVKLNADLVKRIHALAQQRQLSVNEVTAELLEKGLGGR
jgi:undecaprenyl pyrophosphate synthase